MNINISKSEFQEILLILKSRYSTYTELKEKFSSNPESSIYFKSRAESVKQIYNKLLNSMDKRIKEDLFLAELFKEL